MFLRCLVLTDNVYWYVPVKQHSKWYVPVQDKTKKNFDRLGSTRKQIRFEDYLLKKIEEDRVKTNQSFSEWVKDACSKKLDN